MFGVVLYEMLTGARLFTTIALHSDAITPKDMGCLRHWKGLSEVCKTKVLSGCNPTTYTCLDLECQNAISLLTTLLVATPEERLANFPNGMGDVLKHQFWEPAVVALGDDERIRSEALGVSAAYLLDDFEADVKRSIWIASENPEQYGLDQSHNFDLETLTFTDLAPIMAYHHENAPVVSEPALSTTTPTPVLAQGHGKMCPRDGLEHCSLVRVESPIVTDILSLGGLTQRD